MGITIYETVRLLLELYRALLVGSILLSWLPVDRWHPLVRFIDAVTEPVLAPFRRILPPVGGIDFSPILVFAVYSFVVNLILTSLRGLVA